MPYRPLAGVDSKYLAEIARGHDHGDMDPMTALYMLARVPVADEQRRRYWTAWGITAFLSASASAAVIALILSRRRLRLSVFNHLIIGLAIPDFVFSFCCLGTCGMHVLMGRWYDGEGMFHGDWMCDFQSWFSVFGAAGSMWVNVLITWELFRASSSARRLVTYSPPTLQSIYARLSVVFVLVGAFSWLPSFGYRLFPGLPMRSYAVRGLNCLPVAYDRESHLVLLIVILGVVALTPTAVVVSMAMATLYPGLFARCPARKGDAIVAPSRRARASWEDARLVDAAAASPSTASSQMSRARARTDAHKAGAGRLKRESSRTHPSPLSVDSYPGQRKREVSDPAAGAVEVDERTAHAFMLFFARLFVIMFALWMPFFVGWAFPVPYDSAGTLLTWLVGEWAHLQGLVSAILYSHKEDLRAEWVQVGDELRQLLGCLRPRAHTLLSRGHIDRRTGSVASPTMRSSSSYAVLVDEADALACSIGSAGRRASEPPFEPGSLPTLSAARTHTSSDLELAMAAVAAEAEANIVAHEQTPMLVVGWLAWQLSGEIPRCNATSSRRVWRERKESDVIIFISHRWWSALSLRPDDAEHTKYHLIIEGVRLLIAQHGLSEEHAAIWIDFACINQDDPVEQARGIASLITYAARSSYVLIPVEPTVEAMEALHTAEHPIELLNYGERAWCRCEIYVFLCLAEVTRRAVAVFGFGDLDIGLQTGAGAGKWRSRGDSSSTSGKHVTRDSRVDPLRSSANGSPTGSARSLDSHRSSAAEDRQGSSAHPRDKAAARTAGPSAGCSMLVRVAAACTDVLRSLRLVSGPPRRQLRELLTTSAGLVPRGATGALHKGRGLQRGHFLSGELPSSGEVTLESDRQTIRDIESNVRRWFVHASILAEKARFSFDLAHSSALRAGWRGCAFVLEGKQLETEHVPLLASVLLGSAEAAALTRLSLRHNLLTDSSVHPLMSSIVLAERMCALNEIDLSWNVNISSSGLAALAAAAGHPNFRMRTLRLRGCALEPEAGTSLSFVVTAGVALRELDVRDNKLDNEAVSIIASAAEEERRSVGRHTALLVDGNPISARVFQLVALEQMHAAGIVVEHGATHAMQLAEGLPASAAIAQSARQAAGADAGGGLFHCGRGAVDDESTETGTLPRVAPGLSRVPSTDDDADKAGCPPFL